MAELICFLFAGTLSIALFVSLIAWSAYFRHKWDGERWTKVAAALDLEFEPGGSIALYSGPNIAQRMAGARSGVPFWVGIRSQRRGRQMVYYTYVEASILPPLGIGLRVSPASWLAGFIDENDLQVGHPALDAGYQIGASVADQARRLLTAASVRDPLLRFASARFKPHLRDGIVRLEAVGKCMSADVLRGVIGAAVELSRRLAAARDALGPSHVERVIGEAWRAIADARGLTLDADRNMMAGRTEGVHVEVHAAQRGDAYTTTFLVRFDRPLGIGLRLEHQGGLSQLGAFIGMQDIETGDAAFDKRFIVKGRPEAAVRAALTPDVRARLASLQEHAASLTVEDDQLRADVAWLVSEPAKLHEAIEATAQAGAALSGAVAEREVGPYRS